MSHYVLLTGGTGLLGRYLIRDLTDRGVSLALLVRPTRKMSARQRVEALMSTWDAQLGRQLPWHAQFVVIGKSNKGLADLTQVANTRNSF